MGHWASYADRSHPKCALQCRNREKRKHIKYCYYMMSMTCVLEKNTCKSNQFRPFFLNSLVVVFIPEWILTKCVQKQNIILFSEVCPQQPINVTSVKQQIASPNFPNFYAAYVHLISVSDASSVTIYLLLSYFLSLRGHYTNSIFEKWFLAIFNAVSFWPHLLEWSWHLNI